MHHRSIEADMSIPNPYGLYFIVELNYNKVFVCHPFSYANGFTKTIDNNDFSSFFYSEFVTRIQGYMQEEFKKVYYYEPDETLVEGLCLIANDVHYVGFIFDAYRTDGNLFVYIDHSGVVIEQWFGDELNERDDRDSCIMGGDNEDELDNLIDTGVDSTSKIVIINRTLNEYIWSKLNATYEKNELHNTEGDKGKSNPHVQVHVIFNESLHW
ncbi:unnamed protein product [Lactuca saligna]|uniref:Uncharacterized protein n=1 Tax=Lactuca saligna TaxID=75948 RepID=A0AA35ZS24_LACSI|nr:unnamed protein product [Lactuca saligna]